MKLLLDQYVSQVVVDTLITWLFYLGFDPSPVCMEKQVMEKQVSTVAVLVY